MRETGGGEEKGKKKRMDRRWRDEEKNKYEVGMRNNRERN